MPNPRHQHAVKIYQQGRDLSGCNPAPIETELWCCPNCTRTHHTDPIEPITYKCICGWWGTKLSLILAQMPCRLPPGDS